MQTCRVGPAIKLAHDFVRGRPRSLSTAHVRELLVDLPSSSQTTARRVKRQCRHSGRAESPRLSGSSGSLLAIEEESGFDGTAPMTEDKHHSNVSSLSWSCTIATQAQQPVDISSTVVVLKFSATNSG
jgi:hypothetical protein